MPRIATERVLLIGDNQRQIEGALAQAMPTAQVTAVGTYFDGIAELSSEQYTTVLACAEPIERRPEAAVQTLRHLHPQGRLVLFGHPTLEPLSRKMLEFGCDDYMIAPASPGEIQQILGSPVLRIAPSLSRPEPQAAVQTPTTRATATGAATAENPLLSGLPLVEVFLDAQIEHPHNAAMEVVNRLNQMVLPSMHLSYTTQPGALAAGTSAEQVTVTHAVRDGNQEYGQLQLFLPRDEDANTARHFLSRLAGLLGKLHDLADRHTRLQKLAITDELTGLYNGRYFRHFLGRIIERAQAKRFPVTLFIFDIDNFKKYNDQYGHCVGDQILQQTGAMMKRCCREHDLVARIGGDEFAVVFWEKEGPRQPKDPKATSPSRGPQTPLGILDRFRAMLSRHNFEGLGPRGQGVLTISGGLAVYPYDARSMEELIAAADHQLMFKAKKAGKNTIFLVGSGEQLPPPGQ